MNFDAHFATGRQHPVCQDYALVRGDVAVVSDGCSSSPMTDFGSRFLCLAASEQETRGGEGIAVRAHDMARQAGLPDGCVDATLGRLSLLGEDEVHAELWGDGVVAGRLREGAVIYYVVTTPNNAPDYLSYHLFPDRKRAFLAQAKEGYKEVRVYIEGRLDQVIQWDLLTPFVTDYHVGLYELVTICTDGVLSFIEHGPTGDKRVPVWDVLQQIMSIRTYEGAFIQRRVGNGFLRRFCAKNKWEHFDDLGVIGVHLGDLSDAD